MKKTILVLILEQYADWEAAYISTSAYMLTNGKYEVKTVSLSKEPIHSTGGLCVIPDYDILSMPEDYEALLLIGGMSWRTEEAQKVKPIAQKCFKSGKLLGGICDAAGFLGTAGILNTVSHTGNDLNDLKQWAGSSYTGESNYVMKPAVSDQNIITANGTAPLEFAREVLLALKAAPEDKIIEWYHFHKLGIYEAPMPKDATSWAD